MSAGETRACGPAARPGGGPRPCDPAELRTLFLFEHLDDDQLDRLCRTGRVEEFDAGPVFAEGDPAACFYVLLQGTVVLSRRIGQDDVEVNRTSQRGVYAGAFTAYLGDRAPQTYNSSMRVTVPSRFYVLSAEEFARIVQEWFPMAVHLLEGLFFGNRTVQQEVSRRERLLALGSLTAGLTHELNNPAAAALRATAALRDRVAGMRHKLRLVAGGSYRQADLETLIALQDGAAEQVVKAEALGPMGAADREDAVADWLKDHGIGGGWDLAPVFVQAGLDPQRLDRVAAAVGADVLESAVRWLAYTLETELLMNEIEDCTGRISGLVGAARQYSQLDRAPYRAADVHELLDSTLQMLAGRIGPDVTVVREFDRTLPSVPGRPGELNQVWTNLIDNAVSAMDGSGTLTVRTSRAHDRLAVDFLDTGPGVPAEIRERIFEPFFTTKPVGQGTGLGLDISWRIVVGRRHGSLEVESEPGSTRFRVLLPLTAAAPDAEEAAAP